MMRPNICKEQFCTEEIQEDHCLCSEHQTAEQEGTIDKCPYCEVYKDKKYHCCRKCNKSQRKLKPRRCDSDRTDTRTFDEVFALLENDPKAEAKRLLFDYQQQKCVYCGNVYQYYEFQVEHMVPRDKGGPDHFRNYQLACPPCNQAKGTMTDIEFRKKYASYLPQQERMPADPPIDPGKLQASAPSFEPPSKTFSRPKTEEENSERKNNDSAPSHRKALKNSQPAAPPPKDSVEPKDEPERTSPIRSEELGPVDEHGVSTSKSQRKEECQKRKWHIVAAGALCLIMVGSFVTWHALQPGQPSEQIIALEELEKYERARDAGLQALEDYIIQNPNSPYLDQAKDLIRTYKSEE